MRTMLIADYPAKIGDGPNLWRRSFTTELEKSTGGRTNAEEEPIAIRASGFFSGAISIFLRDFSVTSAWRPPRDKAAWYGASEVLEPIGYRSENPR